MYDPYKCPEVKKCYPKAADRRNALALYRSYIVGIDNKMMLTRKLSRHFSRMMYLHLTKEQMVKVRAENIASGFDYCASHDFIDSNMTMGQAWENAFGFWPDNGGGYLMSDVFIDLWNDAWQMSVEFGFANTRYHLATKKKPKAAAAKAAARAAAKAAARAAAREVWAAAACCCDTHTDGECKRARANGGACCGRAED